MLYTKKDNVITLLLLHTFREGTTASEPLTSNCTQKEWEAVCSFRQKGGGWGVWVGGWGWGLGFSLCCTHKRMMS